MDNNRQHILTNYISYLYTTGRSYDTIGKHIKYVADFLESTEEVNRRGYLSYCLILKSDMAAGKRR